MFTHVILRAIHGDRGHEEFVLANGRTYVLGRATNCAIRLHSPLVSRHHCRFDVHSPFVSFRDLGSRNGTLLNGEDIGHRSKDCTAEEADNAASTEHILEEGDVIRIGDNLFWVDFGDTPEDEAPESEREQSLRAGDVSLMA